MRFLRSFTLIGISFPSSSHLNCFYSKHALFQSSSSFCSGAMRSSSANSVVQEVHGVSQPQPYYSLFLTGGGVSTVQWLLTVPGGSQSIKSVEIPYSRSATQDLLGLSSSSSPPSSSWCSEEVAINLAKAAYEKTIQCIAAEHPRDLADSSKVNVFGVGCSAALVSARPKKGEHRCHIAIYSPESIKVLSIVLDKEAGRSREEEDQVCSYGVLHLLRRQLSLPPLPPSLLAPSPKDVIIEKEIPTPDVLREVAEGRRQHVLLFPGPQPVQHWLSLACARPNLPRGAIVYPGSFNPLHEGHVELVEAAIEWAGQGEEVLVVFEVAAINADKPTLAFDTLKMRLQQFQNHPLLRDKKYSLAVAVTRLPLFASKAQLFPHSHLLVGADTLSRLFDPKYYLRDPTQVGNTSQALPALAKAMTQIASAGCDFVVGGRLQGGSDSSSFRTLEAITADSDTARAMLELFPDMFHGLSEECFRRDLSSTEIRQRLTQHHPSPPPGQTDKERRQ
eukprot:gene7932-8751_t